MMKSELVVLSETSELSVRVMDWTPGTPRMASSTRACRATSLGAGYCLLDGLMSKRRRWSARKPGSMELRLMRVRMKSAEPTTSIVESATWNATIALPLQALRCLVAVLPPSLRAVPISAFVADQAGAGRKIFRERMVTAAVNRKTRQWKERLRSGCSQALIKSLGTADRPVR